MWRHLASHDAPKPWQIGAMVRRVGFDHGWKQVVLTPCVGAWHWWLIGLLLVYGLGGLCARQG